MTLIVAMKDADDVYLSSDVRLVIGPTEYRTVGSHGKICEFHPGCAFGVTGTPALLHAMRRQKHRLDEGAIEDCIERNDVEDLVGLLFDALATDSVLEYINKDREYEPDMLMVFNHDIYGIGPGFNIYQPKLSYEAIGSGCEFAKGAIHAYKGSITMDRLKGAFEAASKFEFSVSSEFKVWSSKLGWLYEN